MISLSRLWETIILLGVVQGFILSGLLFSSGRQQLANRILAVLIGLITLACFNIYMLDAAWLNSHTLLRLLANALPLVVVMPLGPLIWFYVHANMATDFHWSRKHLVHFYPVLIDLFPYITVLVADIGALTGLVSKGQRLWVSDFVDAYNVYADIPRWVSVTVYGWLSYRYVVKHRDRQPAMPEGTARWLQQFLVVFLVFQAIWFLYLIPYIIPATRQALLDAVDWYPVFVPLAVMIYWLGFKGYLVHYKSSSGQARKVPVPVSRMPDTTAEQFIGQLQKIMEEEKLYLDPALTVNKLAQQAGMTPKAVSAVLNQNLQKGFPTFVNEYRVSAFKKRILEQDAGNLTIPGIAMECGFSSAATFQRIFKQLTGITPSRFIQEAKQAETANTRPGSGRQ